jgi:hypothetical protein
MAVAAATRVVVPVTSQRIAPSRASPTTIKSPSAAFLTGTSIEQTRRTARAVVSARRAVTVAAKGAGKQVQVRFL